MNPLMRGLIRANLLSGKGRAAPQCPHNFVARAADTGVTGVSWPVLFWLIWLHGQPPDAPIRVKLPWQPCPVDLSTGPVDLVGHAVG